MTKDGPANKVELDHVVRQARREQTEHQEKMASRVIPVKKAKKVILVNLG